MFGYLTINPEIITPEQKHHYQTAYCGLCRVLNSDYGPVGAQTLSYDLTLVAMILSSLYPGQNIESGQQRCPFKPVKPHDYYCDSMTHYAGAMNIFLTYYKCLDDYHDDGSLRQKKRADKLQSWVDGIVSRYGEQCDIMTKCLSDIAVMEEHNELNSDLPANCFGSFMQQLFCPPQTQPSTDLLTFGFHLGKFIYLMDACLDLHEDLKKQRYNPLISLDMTDYQDVLMMVAADMTAAYEKLPLTANKDIIDNVLYSGIWGRYQLYQKAKMKGTRHERPV